MAAKHRERTIFIVVRFFTEVIPSEAVQLNTHTRTGFVFACAGKPSKTSRIGKDRV